MGESVVKELQRWNSAVNYSRSATGFKVTELGFTAFFPSFFLCVWWRWSAFHIPRNSIRKTKEQNPYFSRGCLLGVCWRSLPGGGFLVSRSWTFSGPNVIYLYPDCRFGFLRSFCPFVCDILLSQKDSPGWNFSKLWCGASQTLWGPRLCWVSSGLGELQIYETCTLEVKIINEL